MRTAGIIAEYNPFHAGHAYHIEATRQKANADYVVVVMSGDYVQRGAPAITDKYIRTRLALLGGADVVLELPTVYATASAEYFASAGVGILDRLGCVDVLSFGSEWAESEAYGPYVELLLEEPPAYRAALREALRAGKNFPAARAEALARCLRDSRAADFLKEPNHILGLEYHKALRRQGSEIEPLAILRRGSGYHEAAMRTAYPSATAIRQALSTMAHTSRALRRGLGAGGDLFLEHFLAGEHVSWQDLMPHLDYQMLFSGEHLTRYFGVDEALARRIKKRYVPGLSEGEVLERLHEKNRTDTALRRALLHICLQIEDRLFLKNAADIPLPYVRVLGFRRRAVPLLREMRGQQAIDVIQKPAEMRKRYPPGEAARALFLVDEKSEALYEQIAAGKVGRAPVSLFQRQQVIVD